MNEVRPCPACEKSFAGLGSLACHLLQHHGRLFELCDGNVSCPCGCYCQGGEAFINHLRAFSPVHVHLASAVLGLEGVPPEST